MTKVIQCGSVLQYFLFCSEMVVVVVVGCVCVYVLEALGTDGGRSQHTLSSVLQWLKLLSWSLIC